MLDAVKYRPMEAGEETELYELVSRVFYQHVAPLYSEKGVEKFFALVSPQWLCAQEALSTSFTIVAAHGNTPVGMLTVVNESHVALFFVDSSEQGMGIGRSLMQLAICRCQQINPLLRVMTVSASPNSVPFYERIGFVVQEEQIDEEGMLYTPMKKQIR